MSSTENKTIQKKICLLGDFSVGKTSLVRRFIEGRFDDKYLSSIGVKISRRTLARAGHTLNLLIWDLAGGEAYAGSSYLRGAAGALLVCDLTRRASLDVLTTYVADLRTENPRAVLVLAGNKADLTEACIISAEELAALGAQWASPYFLTSALDGTNVAEAFNALADRVEVA